AGARDTREQGQDDENDSTAHAQREPNSLLVPERLPAVGLEVSCRRAKRRVSPLMRIAVIGPSGRGKTRLAGRLARMLGVAHVEIDALPHGPNWESCSPDVLRERVAEATAGDEGGADGTHHKRAGGL